MPPAATSWASCLDDSLHFVFIVKPILCLIVNTVCVESWVGVCDEFKVREKNYKKNQHIVLVYAFAKRIEVIRLLF